MSTTPVSLDFSAAKPITPAASTPPPKPAGVSLDFSAAKPVNGATPPPAPATGPQDAFANTRSEGIYQMDSPDGRQVQIPYSKVKTAGPQGYRFSNQGELARYAKDHAADPIDESAIDKYLDNVPWWDLPGHALNLLNGAGTGALKTFTGNDREKMGHGAGGELEQNMRLAAATPTKGAAAGLGELGENVGEFFSGEELLGMVSKGLQGAARLKAATQAAQLLEQHPVIAKLVKIGQNAVRTGAIGGAQTFAKTGDVGAAASTGLETAATGGLIEGAGAGASSAVRKLTPAVSHGAEDFAGEARAAVQPHLESVSNAIADAGNPKPAAGAIIPLTALAPKVDEAAKAAKAAFNVDHVLNTVHDFTGAADRLATVNDAAYNAIDAMTGGQFKTLNSEVKAAQSAAFRAPSPQTEKAYRDATQKMDDLLSSTKGLKPETVQAIKAGWKASYQLRDVGNIWDRALNGVPGASKVSQEQRGINGNVLMSGLQKAVRDIGRPQLEATLGAGRLDNLERIARMNQTNAQRQVFNRGLHEVARYLPIYLGARVGEHVAGFPGEVGGVLFGGAVKPAVDAVLDAIKANPRIGNNLTYAIESGADPKKFGPLVATMIQQANTDAARQKQGEDTQ